MLCEARSIILFRGSRRFEAVLGHLQSVRSEVFPPRFSCCAVRISYTMEMQRSHLSKPDCFLFSFYIATAVGAFQKQLCIPSLPGAFPARSRLAQSPSGLELRIKRGSSPDPHSIAKHLRWSTQLTEDASTSQALECDRLELLLPLLLLMMMMMMMMRS